MQPNTSSSSDHALLARLNALRRSHIELDTEANKTPLCGNDHSLSVNPAPSRALQDELTARFNQIQGRKKQATPASTEDDDSGMQDEGKTIEELLSDLGADDSWQLPIDEETQIDSLIETANQALRKEQDRSTAAPTEDEARNNGSATDTEIASIEKDIRATKPHEPHAKLHEADLDEEADEYLAQVLDQLRSAPAPDELNKSSKDASGAILTQDQRTPPSDTFPQTPSSSLDEPPSYNDVSADDELSSRFANLGLPSVPAVAPIKAVTKRQQQIQKGYTDEDIDSWCCICNEDATLRCRGCDDDLYCTTCWLDGHKGPDAGYDEGTHKAVQYNKGGGIGKKEPRRMVGA